MSDFAQLFDDMMKQGQDMARKFAPGADGILPKGFEDLMPGFSKEFLEMAFGNTINRNGLDAKTRFLITIAALTAQGAMLKPQLKLAMTSACTAGASTQEISEVIFQMSAFGGLPATTTALEIANEVFGNKDESGAA